MDINTGRPVQFDDPTFDEIFYTVVIKDNFEHMEEFEGAVREEIEGLKLKEVFFDVKKSSLD